MRSRDSIDVVPLTHLKTHSTPSLTHSEHDPNPFTNVPLEPLSPFDDVHAVQESLLQSSHGKRLSVTLEESTINTNLNDIWQPTLISTQLHSKSPPEPLIETTATEKEGDVRWWHEWLCGCGEGSDRGGDNQVRQH